MSREITYKDIESAYHVYLRLVQPMFESLSRTAFFQAVVLINGKGTLGNEQMSLSVAALKSLKEEVDKTIASLEKKLETIEVVVATEEDTGDQALYLDGRIAAMDGTIYAADIDIALDGRDARIRAVTAKYEGSAEGNPWPNTVEELTIVHE